jgi:hypothetical protein
VKQILSDDLGMILQHDNAPAHKTLSVKQFLSQKSITEMEHPLCTPDFASNDFLLFSEIKSALEGRRFQDTEDIKNVMTESYSKNVSNSDKQHRWAKCIAAQGAYFESDPSQLYI